MEYESIPYALLYEENDKPAFSKISTLLSKTYVFVAYCFVWAGPQKVLFLKQPHFHMAYFPGRVVGGTYSHLITIKIVWGVFEQLVRYTMRYQESDLHLGIYSSLNSARN